MEDKHDAMALCEMFTMMQSLHDVQKNMNVLYISLMGIIGKEASQHTE